MHAVAGAPAGSPLIYYKWEESMRLISAVALLLVVMLFTGCATMNESQCLSGNWARAGYEDGAAGYPASRLTSHEKACSAHGVRADATTYLDARERGLREYCTPHRGYFVGSEGRNYANVCPVPLERGFLAGFADGRRVHEAKQYAHELAAETGKFERTIRTIRKDITSAEGRLAKADLSDTERSDLRRELRALREDLRRADDDLRRAERREHSARQDLSQLEYRFDSAYRRY